MHFRRWGGWRHALQLGVVGGLFAIGTLASAGVLRYCDADGVISAQAQSRLLQFSDIAKAQLQASGAQVALTSVAGLDLDRLGIRYSHMGISLQTSAHGPWAVRQLYFDCEQRQSRLFDQGIAGFATGRQPTDAVYLSLLLLPQPAAEALAVIARDNASAMALLGGTYSANAYPFSDRYQNCNQWVLEMLATAWGALPIDGDVRANAQQWLRDQGYTPDIVKVGWTPLMWLSGQLPWLHRDDHPAQDQQDLLYRVSLPQSIESFARAQQPDALRIELCMQESRVVIRRGWQAIGATCEPEANDETVELK